MLTMWYSNTFVTVRLKHLPLKLDHLSNFLRYKHPVFGRNKFLHYFCGIRLCKNPTSDVPYVFLCNYSCAMSPTCSGYIIRPISSRTYADSSIFTQCLPRFAPQCKLQNGALLQGIVCNFNHVHPLSLSARKFSELDSKKEDALDGHHIKIVTKLQSLENKLRYHGYSTVRIGLFMMCALGVSLYIFRESIRENVADEVSQVATRSLDDELVVGKVEQFAKGLLDAIMNDEQMTKLAGEFVVGVLQREETKQATARVLLSVIDDPKTREHLIMATKQVFLAALYDANTQKALKVVFKNILADGETRKAAEDLLTFVFAEEDVKNAGAEFFKDVIKMDVVVKQATSLGKDVTHNVITDPVIQRETGDTIWQAVTHSITPRWFSGSTPSTPPPPEITSPEMGETEGKAASTPEVEEVQNATASQESETEGTEDRTDTKDANDALQEEQNEQKQQDEQKQQQEGLDIRSTDL